MLDLTKQQREYMEEMYLKFPKPIIFNNVIQTNLGLLQFYNSKNDNKAPFYNTMNKGRMASILYQIIRSKIEKDETKKKAVSMFIKIFSISDV
jgi:hypothetical protein